MRKTFYDLVDTYQDDAVELEDAGVTDAERVEALTMARLRPQAVVTAPAPAKGKAHRPARTALIAAVMALALSVTAYAAYQARIADYFLPEAAPAETAASDEAAIQEAAAEQTASPAQASMSMVGYQGTPEYEAYAEWTAWQKENPSDFSSVGGDDSYHETPDNYAVLYRAYFQDEADKLDEIMAKYGLTPLEARHSVYAPEEIYDALGTDPFLPDDAGGGGYIYNDGTFKLEAMDLNGADASMYVSVKGSFSMISSGVDQNYEEWSYTTSGGQTVDLVRAAYDSYILFETPGAYIYVNIDAGSQSEYDPELDPLMDKEWFMEFEREAQAQIAAMGGELTDEEIEADWEAHVQERLDAAEQFPPQAVTKEQLEAIADSIDLGVLAQRFDGTMTREQATAAYYAFVDRLESATDTYNRTDDADAAIAAIGDYTMTAPEGYSLYSVGGQTADDPIVGNGYSYVTRYWQGAGGEIILTWTDDPQLSEIAPLSFSLDAASREMVDAVYPEQSMTMIGGWEARCLEGENFAQVEWFNEDLGLRFQLTSSWAVDLETLVSVAQSVTEQ